MKASLHVPIGRDDLQVNLKGEEVGRLGIFGEDWENGCDACLEDIMPVFREALGVLHS